MSYIPISAIQALASTFGYNNASGISMPVTTPVRVRADGDVDYVNVSVEADVFAIVGVVSELTLPNAQAPVMTSGRLLNINTSFLFGDPVYINKAGDLTNIKPTIGVNSFISGDYVVRIGTISKNTENPLLKDLIISLNLVGQL